MAAPVWAYFTWYMRIKHNSDWVYLVQWLSVAKRRRRQRDNVSPLRILFYFINMMYISRFVKIGLSKAVYMVIRVIPNMVLYLIDVATQRLAIKGWKCKRWYCQKPKCSQIKENRNTFSNDYKHSE